MEPSGTLCRVSILKDAKFSASSSRAPRNWITIFCGVRPVVFPNVDGSASSTAPIMRMWLVVRVHPELLRSQGLPEELRDEKTVWEGRYRSIVDMEKHLHRNGTRIVKIFLHLSQKEQRKRFLARIDEPDKNWKFSLADIHERKYLEAVHAGL